MNPNQKTWLVCATKPEWSLVKKNIPFVQVEGCERFYQSGDNLFLLQTGIGPQRALESVVAVFQKYRPERVIHFGVSGGLDETLKAGDVLTPSEIVMSKFQNLVLNDSLPGVAKAKFFTSQTVLSTPEEKKDVFSKTGCAAVDMESYPLAQFFLQNKISYLSLRGIFDEVDHDLSVLGEAQTMSANGELLPLNLAMGLIKKPKLIMSLPQFQRAMSLVSKNIWNILQEQLST